MRTKLVLGLLFAAAVLLVTAMPTAAATRTATTLKPVDPQTTNVPYLAWNGEEVRLVKCYGSGDGVTSDMMAVSDSVLATYLSASFHVLGWTGSPAPFTTSDNVEANTVAVYHSSGGICVRGDVVSLNPGLAQIEMDVAFDFSKAPLNNLNGLVVLPKHVFLAAWMNLLAPTIHELSNADLTAVSANQDQLYGQPAALFGPNYSASWPAPVVTKGMMLGDPAGDGVFKPIIDAKGVNHLLDGLVSVHVKGQFPNGAGAMWTMPDDWAALAAQYESDSVSPIGHDVTQWDIHNAVSWDPRALLQTVLDPTVVGPFDPIFPETVLTDGTLDIGDAPMPAARIDFTIAAGGVGGFAAATKADIYVKDASVPFGTAGNAYAPFYTQYIPATYRDYYAASGIDGPAPGNNFLGFLVGGSYPNWTLLNTQTNDPLRATNPNTCKDEYGNVRVSPVRVPDTVSVYTDEHGEGIVAYDPDMGFYFTSNNDLLCDLGENVPANATAATPSDPVLLGSSTIKATAFYPYKPVAPLTGIDSNPIVKSVFGDPAKFLRCIAKDDKFHAFCVEVIRDLYGNPVSGAKVQFTVEPGAKLIPAALKFGGFDSTDQSYWANATNTTVYAQTGAHGQVGVEVVSTLGGQVDLLAENLTTRNGGSGILRDACINYSGSAITATYNGCAGGSGTPATPPAAGGSVTTSSGSNNSGASNSAGSNAAGTSVQTPSASPVGLPAGIQHPTVAKAKLVSVKLVATKLGRYLTVKVSSPDKTATIKVTLIGKNGKVMKVVTRKVATNKVVRVPNLAIAKTVRTTKVSVVR